MGLVTQVGSDNNEGAAPDDQDATEAEEETLQSNRFHNGYDPYVQERMSPPKAASPGGFLAGQIPRQGIGAEEGRERGEGRVERHGGEGREDEQYMGSGGDEHHNDERYEDDEVAELLQVCRK